MRISIQKSAFGAQPEENAEGDSKRRESRKQKEVGEFRILGSLQLRS